MSRIFLDLLVFFSLCAFRSMDFLISIKLKAFSVFEQGEAEIFGLNYFLPDLCFLFQMFLNETFGWTLIYVYPIEILVLILPALF